MIAATRRLGLVIGGALLATWELAFGSRETVRRTK